VHTIPTGWQNSPAEQSNLQQFSKYLALCQILHTRAEIECRPAAHATLFSHTEIIRSNFFLNYVIFLRNLLSQAKSERVLYTYSCTMNASCVVNANGCMMNARGHVHTGVDLEDF
jgi:hypothetical protein